LRSRRAISPTTPNGCSSNSLRNISARAGDGIERFITWILRRQHDAVRAVARRARPRLESTTHLPDDDLEMRRPYASVVFLAAAAFVAMALTKAEDTLSVAWPPCDNRRVQMDLWHAPSGERSVMTVAVRNCLRRPLRLAALTVTAKQPLRMVGSSRRTRLRSGGHRAVWQIPTRPHATMWSVRIYMTRTGGGCATATLRVPHYPTLFRSECV
jgi:hypothetical protein